MSPSLLFTGSLTITGGHTPPPVLLIKPGDVIVLSIPNRPTMDGMNRIAHAAKDAFPDHRIVVLAEGTTLSTARAGEIHITD